MTTTTARSRRSSPISCSRSTATARSRATRCSRVDALLTVVYAYLEKGKVTQAISGPYDLGRPKGCKPDWYSHFNRFNPQPLTQKKQPAKKGATRKTTSKKK